MELSFNREASAGKDAHVVCRIFLKSGSGPQNGAQYGAPFLEKEWEEEEEDGVVLMPRGGDYHDAEQEHFEFTDLVQVQIRTFLFIDLYF